MIGEFEQFHGAVVRDLVVGFGASLTIKACDDHGRVNTYVLNENVGVYLKHSSKRLPPWQFTYGNDNICELERLAEISQYVWLVHVCGRDGFVALTLEEFHSINPPMVETTRFVRVDRDRNTMYRVNGTGNKLPRAKPRGLAALIDDLRA